MDIACLHADLTSMVNGASAAYEVYSCDIMTLQLSWCTTQGDNKWQVAAYVYVGYCSNWDGAKEIVWIVKIVKKNKYMKYG